MATLLLEVFLVTTTIGLRLFVDMEMTQRLCCVLEPYGKCVCGKWFCWTCWKASDHVLGIGMWCPTKKVRLSWAYVDGLPETHSAELIERKRDS